VYGIILYVKEILVFLICWELTVTVKVYLFKGEVRILLDKEVFLPLRKIKTTERRKEDYDFPAHLTNCKTVKEEIESN
jgi:hypothetical protein